MILNAYSIFDLKSLVYHPPFFTHTHGSATRMVADLANDPRTSVGSHPADYQLFHVGFYDDAKGQLVVLSPLAHVADVVALVRNNQTSLFPQEQI